VVIEGIETQADLDFAQISGLRFAQGYFFGTSFPII